MDKRVIFAVAGSGKTSLIIDKLSKTERSLIITYTDNNYHHLCAKVINKFGFIPKNITIMSYFNFLYSFCYKPFLHNIYKCKGINWKTPPQFTFRLNRSDKRFYIDEHHRLYHNRIAKLIIERDVSKLIKSRISKYFDNFFVDEVQDFGGHDFNLLKVICGSQVNILFVGDFFQHTFDTSKDGSVNGNLHKSYNAYMQHFEKSGLEIDTKTLSKSYRCTPQVCQYIRDNLGIEIYSHKKENSIVKYISNTEEALEKIKCDNTVKLFYKNHSSYPMFSQNWGKSKGLDNYIDVCVVLYQKATQLYKKGNLNELPHQSRNKLYVACTRANRNLYLLAQTELEKISITTY